MTDNGQITETVQTQDDAKIDELLTKLDTDIDEGLKEARGQFAASTEEYIKGIRQKYTEVLSAEDIDGPTKAHCENILRSIDLIENPDAVVQRVARVKRVLSLNLVQHDKARSLFRRNKIDQLKYPELLAMLKRIKDEEFRNKLTGMFNAVVLYAMENDSPKSLAFFLKFNFMLIRSAVAMGLIPTLAARVYEQAKSV
jgi:hypothetical protein